MTSRQPARSKLPHTITLWNASGEAVVNGGKEKQYQKTVIRYVRYESRRRKTTIQSGGANEDSLFLMIFNGPSVAEGESGVLRDFAPSSTFLTMKQEDRERHWTLQPGDIVGLGTVLGDFSHGGDYERKDYKINIIDPIYGSDGKIHHWEVTGA